MSTNHCAVVVGYDFSHTGHAALRRAVTLVSRAPHHVLHVVCVADPDDPIPSIASYDGVDDRYAARVEEALATAVHAELDLAAPSHRVDFFVHARIGTPADEILELAADVGADLVIIGSHDLGDFDRLILGPVSDAVVRGARCCVEVARRKEYADVALMPVVGRPPQRYEYADHRVLLRPSEWPLH